ncbi:Thimet oligopeptidase [Smittium culicis]|uniref:Thimet oligopeptidase n=1 Tax=Smittium culicis TaxID=133412 RepID=A0A1R1YCA2_9FUNG|nr:Thimet oligopeptidase [Smittium culicis]
MTSRTVHQEPASNLPNFNISIEDINTKADELIAKGKAVHDQVASVPLDEISFDNVIVPLATYENESMVDYSAVTFLQHVSTDKNIRDASMEAEKKLEDFHIESQMRRDVYKVIKALFQSKEKWQDRCSEDKRLLEKTERSYRRNGLDLPDEGLKKLMEIKKKMSELTIKFGRNISEGDAEVLFTLEELDGLPEDFINSKKKVTVDGVEKYTVTTKYPDLFAVLGMANRELTRKTLLMAEERRCKENIDILTETVKLRLQSAKVLSYKTHAEYVLELKMAKEVGKVISFEKNLQSLLEPLAEKEIESLLEVKKENKFLISSSENIFSWDSKYYFRILKERLYNVDDEEVKQYFSISQVTTGLLETYQKMLGLTFTQVDNSTGWHKDATLYTVVDTKTNDFVGHFWMDLHPREGKYNHAACWSLRPGYERADGTREYPISGIVANFSEPTANKPSLLKHNEVVTFFHEFGHVMHNICSKTKWSRLHGTNVETDFVEAPSQMLENWCWQPEVLQNFGKHYLTGEPIPEQLVHQLIKTKNLGAGLFNLRQIFFGLFDMAIHNTESEDIDINEIYSTLRKEICKIDVGEEKTWPSATFGHMMGGYDSGYYGYMWSDVFSADMFYSRFYKQGLFNEKSGIDYRNEILLPGGSRDAMESLVAFLGREPEMEPFLRSIGMK